MAENNILSDHNNSKAWLAKTCEELPNDYLVVVNPVIQQLSLTAIVIGRGRLTILHSGEWKDGKSSSSATVIRKADQALRRYLSDEFPSLRLKVNHLVVLLHPEDPTLLPVWKKGTDFVAAKDLGQAISDHANDTQSEFVTPATYESIATALQERKISRNQRATKPFIFRHGNMLGTDRHAWTLQQVFRHIARYPEDGIYHMGNGTLEQWFHDQGAPDLARLVLQLSSTDRGDSRALLEELLVKSGMIKRAGPAVRPSKLNLGRVITGGNQDGTFNVRSRTRKGYLVVNLETSTPWLQLEPTELKGRGGSVIVHVDTNGLSIQDLPYEAHVRLSSPLFTNTINLPVRMRVVGEPAPVIRRFLRPLAAMFAAVIIGGTIGLAMGLWGILPPSWLSNLVPILSPLAIWGVIFALVWAIGGLIRGFRQPMNLSTGKAMLQWLGRTALWFIPLALLSVTAAWALAFFYPLLVARIPALQNTIIIAALGIAIVPSVLDRDKLQSRYDRSSNPKQRTRRSLVMIGAAIVLALAIVGAALWLPSVWQNSSIGQSKTTIAGWVSSQLGAINSWLDLRTEKFYLDLYDRRATVQPTLKPSATAVRTKAP